MPSILNPLNSYKTEYDIVNSEKNSSTIKLNLPHISDAELPTVSVVVPTYNRSHFYQLILRNFDRIQYPFDKLELIILDDSELKNDSSIFKKDPRIRYITSPTKLTIGKKRNMLCKYAKYKYIVHMDDDDWYPPESVVSRIRMLLAYEKKLGKDCCFGCDKVLCFDLISNQMFESYDMSSDGTPATISESTMAYSKRYWDSQKWDNTSEITECLPFIKNRYDTICSGPSVFIVTQFTHTENTVERRITKTMLSDRNSDVFQSNMTVYDSQIFNDIRASIIYKIPSYKKSIEFIKNIQGLSTQKIKNMYEILDEEIKSNPLTMSIIREKFVDNTRTRTSGKDIVYYCGPGSHLNFSSQWNPESQNIGGSEEAVINLSRELVKRGYNVTVYCVLKGPSKKYDGVTYKKYYEWIPMDLQDVTIIWRDPSNCNQAINSRKVFLDLHDAIDASWLNDLDPKIIIMTKSMYHKNIIGCKNAVCIPNGIYKIDQIKTRQKNLMVCTSSPDRCIRALIRLLPIIRKEIPDAEIHWAYGFSSGISDGGMETNPVTKEWVEETKELIKNTEGFKDMGRLSQTEVNNLYAKADLFIYPTIFPEIDCISLTKAMSAGCLPICTPSGAISEKMGIKKQIAKLVNDKIDYSLEDGIIFNNFAKEIIRILKSERDSSRQVIMDLSNEQYNWDIIVDKWISYIISL